MGAGGRGTVVFTGIIPSAVLVDSAAVTSSALKVLSIVKVGILKENRK